MELKVRLKQKADYSYSIVLGKNLFKKIAADLKNKPIANKYVIITDSNVKNIYGIDLLKTLRANNIEAQLIYFKAGEQSKNSKIKEQIENEMFKLLLGRDSAILALGGGVTGDLAGFIASTFLRGIPYIQIPTTLLAMVDSSIGGKTGINTGYGKNLIGTFYQPKKVYIDINMLSTLPESEFLNGLAEVIKHSIIKDKPLFKYLEKNREKILKKDKKALQYIIKISCEIKSSIVEKDETESNYRRILNFGHTFGHAIEKTSNYQVKHGFAVAQGMIYAAKLSKTNEKTKERIIKLIESYGLIKNIKLDKKMILHAMLQDKKTIKGKVNFVLINEIGKPYITNKIKTQQIEAVL